MKREAIDRSDSLPMITKLPLLQTSNDLRIFFYVDGLRYPIAVNGLTVPLDDYFTEEDQKDFVDSAITQNTIRWSSVCYWRNRVIRGILLQ